jgi:hypothetical protein
MPSRTKHYLLGLFIASVVAGLLLSLYWWRVPRDHKVDFKGIELGATESDVRKTFPAVTCKYHIGSKKEVAQCEDSKGSIAGAPAQVFFFFGNMRVIEIDVVFDSANYEAVISTLAEKYGGERDRSDVGDQWKFLRYSGLIEQELVENDDQIWTSKSDVRFENKSTVTYLNFDMFGDEEGRRVRDL